MILQMILQKSPRMSLGGAPSPRDLRGFENHLNTGHNTDLNTDLSTG